MKKQSFKGKQNPSYRNSQDKNQFEKYFNVQCEKLNQAKSEGDIDVIEKAQQSSQYSQINEKQKSKIIEIKNELNETLRQCEQYRSQINSYEEKIKNVQIHKQSKKKSKEVSPSKIVQYVEELKKDNQKYYHELNLETQSRQVLQQQIRDLQVEIDSLQRENSSLKQNISVFKHKQQVNDYQNQTIEITSKSQLQIYNSPERRLSPKRVYTPQLEKVKFQNQIEQIQISKLNLEKTLEQKQAEFSNRENFLNEKIGRLEKQIKSRNAFEKDKQVQLQESQKQYQQLKQQFDAHKIQVQNQMAELNLIINQLKTSKGQQETILKSLQQEKYQLEKRYNDQIELIKNLKAQQSELSTLKAKDVEEMAKTLQKFEKKIKKRDQKLQEQQNKNNEEIKILHEKLSKSEESLQNSNQILEQQENKLILTTQKLQEAGNELHQLKEQLQKQLEENATLKDNLDLTQVEVNNYKRLIKQLESQNKELDKKWKDEIARLQSYIDNIDVNIEKLHSTNTSDAIELVYSTENDNKFVLQEMDAFEADFDEGLVSQLKNIQAQMLELNIFIKGD